ncbi:aspartate carbamoyltransferase catalytic subunit [Sulfitobacter sp. SK012]|uniref:aspartate carbamoyltransferase catalytic subunit n=1 Tax=Sulfitobacter sp. SK012 TaxID=1389005 RepID=UPI000E0C51FA|nr:aspartate carbamoyltransferase catalytic subunit [Sulfitobacter sp. SK012]AXI45296.1 aspartate carbamoyltransferase catalytic subunit [Sulfitobacter sp. SK012]
MNTTAQITSDPWGDILQRDEKILWQGRPDGGFRMRSGDLSSGIFGVVFTAFSIFWMSQAVKAAGFIWMFGLLFFAAGLRLIYKAVLGDTLRRRHSFYTLTSHRAFIATDMPFKARKLDSYPITADSPLSLQTGTFDTITFAARKRRGKNGTVQTPISFQDIDPGQKVFQMMSRIQKGDAL